MLVIQGYYSTNDNDMTYYNDDHNNNFNNNSAKEIKIKEGIGSRAACLLCDKIGVVRLQYHFPARLEQSKQH